MKTKFLLLLLFVTSMLFAQHIQKTYLLSDTTRFSDKSGHGYDILRTPTKQNRKPFYYSISLPDGNYKVTVKLGSKKQAGVTTVRAESRRLFVNQQITKKKEFVELSFVVNKRTPYISDKEKVKIKEKENTSLTWDNKLTLEFNGEAPVCESIRIEPDTSATTIYLCGNSTVVDQTREPWASWGQMIPYFFNTNVVFANHAESGLSADSFIGSGRLKKIISEIKEGDYVLIEFGHNDQKQSGPGVGAYYSFMTNLKMYIDEARAKGAIPVLITPTQRRKFDENGKNQNSHGEYPDAIRWLAAKENVALVDLNEITNTLIEAFGSENSKKLFVHYRAGTFSGQNKTLADNTHFSSFGAYEVAKCVITGMLSAVPKLTAQLKPGFLFNPEVPDPFETFKWDLSTFTENEKPDGD